MLRGDDAQWTAVSESMRVPRERMLLVKQVHGISIAVANSARAIQWPKPQADIIVSDDPSVAIGVRVADCAPILLYDPRRNVAGAVHAGWRGAAAHAALAAVRGLQQEFGVDPSDLIAAIGPCLGKCCGEVGPEVVEAFRAGGADHAAITAWFSPGVRDRSFLDLERANHDQLERAGREARSSPPASVPRRTTRGSTHIARPVPAPAACSPPSAWQAPSARRFRRGAGSSGRTPCPGRSVPHPCRWCRRGDRARIGGPGFCAPRRRVPADR